MKRCERCHSLSPDAARYCMQCGLLLLQTSERPQASPGRYNMFLLSIVGSIGLSLILVYVFKLPIFFLAGFLPLLWQKRK